MPLRVNEHDNFILEICGAIAAAMLIDALVPSATAAPIDDCTETVHPVLHALEFVDAPC